MDVSTDKDETELYDQKHGHTTLTDEQKPSGLSEGSNQPPPQESSIRITTSR